jgi:16S rRNA (uracil1498-N3)-methyltransferase
MRVNRIYTPGQLAAGKDVELTPTGANHIVRVLRARVGDVIGVFDGEGNEFRAAIASVKGSKVIVRVDAAAISATEAPLRITLTQGISRGERMDWVVQKATELGVASIVPVITARSVVKLDRDQAEKKHEHWRSIAIGACEQCGRSRLPKIATPISLTQHLCSASSAAMRVVLDPEAAKSLTSLEAANTIELLIGPEGGLDNEELAAAKKAGFVSATLGPRILRTETAAVAALAILQAKWGDLGGSS